MKQINANSEAAEKAAIANLDKSKKQKTQKSKSNLKLKESKLHKKKEQFKKLTGRKRVKKEEAEALKVITAKQLAKQLTQTKEQINKTSKRRLKTFEKTYGEATEEQRKLLTYATASQVAKLYSIEKLGKAKEEKTVVEEVAETTTKEEKTKPDPIQLSIFSVYYDDLPASIKQWSHKSDSFIYNNTLYDGEIKLQDLTDGTDHKASEFLDIIFSEVEGLDDFLYDPENSGEDVIYDKDEWKEYDND